MDHKSPTSDSELNGVLREIVNSTHAILRDDLLGVYLHGSFALGDWDVHSDVDYLVVIDRELTKRALVALQEMHGRIHDLDSHWAQHLEGSYFPKLILKRADAAGTPLWYLDNGSRELVLSAHDNTLVVRWMVRECGITLAGPDPRELIEPIRDDDLRHEVWETMLEWAHEITEGCYDIGNRWAQPFAVLSYCRMLHTLETARIDTKPAGAKWGVRHLDARWSDLIRRAWDDRPNPSWKVRQPAHLVDVDHTLAFIQYTLDVGKGMRFARA